jgi:hypothetical protein
VPNYSVFAFSVSPNSHPEDSPKNYPQPSIQELAACGFVKESGFVSELPNTAQSAEIKESQISIQTFLQDVPPNEGRSISGMITYNGSTHRPLGKKEILGIVRRLHQPTPLCGSNHAPIGEALP